MTYAVDRLRPLEAGLVRMAFGAAGSWLFLGESVGPVVLLAGALILGGVHLVLGARHA